MKHPHADSIKSHIDKIRVIASQAEINRTSLEAIEHEVLEWLLKNTGGPSRYFLPL